MNNNDMYEDLVDISQLNPDEYPVIDEDNSDYENLMSTLNDDTLELDLSSMYGDDNGQV